MKINSSYRNEGENHDTGNRWSVCTSLHYTGYFAMYTDESRIKLDVSGVDNRRLRQIILVISSPNFS